MLRFLQINILYKTNKIAILLKFKAVVFYICKFPETKITMNL